MKNQDNPYGLSAYQLAMNEAEERRHREDAERAARRKRQRRPYFEGERVCELGFPGGNDNWVDGGSR